MPNISESQAVKVNIHWINTHREAIPFFIGLVLGDYIPRSIYGFPLA
jgi:hypothetical protein